MSRRPFAFLALVLFTIPVFAQKQWTEVSSQHFSVLTDTGEKQGKEIALRFEQMRAVFASLFHKPRVSLPVPLQIVAFRNQGEFRNYAPLWKGKPVELAGYFQGADDRSFIALDMSAPDPYAVVFHEYAHLLLRANFPRMPVWFDEGFAEYFSSLRITDKTVEYGHVPENLPAILQSNRWMPILDLFNTQHDSATYNERDQKSLFYAQSWITVHYIMSEDKLPQAANFLQLTQIEHKPVAESIKQAFGVEPTALEKSIHDYFSGSSKYFRADAPVFEAGPFESKRVNDLTSQAILADLHAHSSDYQQQAVSEFQAVLEKDPGNEIATRGLGYLYLKQGEYDKASELFKRASLTESKDPRLFYLSALLTNRIAIKEGKPPSQPQVMRQQLEQAIALDPTFADAYNLLAFALAANQKYDAAVSAEKKAIELNASYEPYQINLAHLYLQWQKWDDAQAVLARLQLSTDPETRKDATDLIATLQSNREMAAQIIRDRELRHDDITAPQWRRKEGSDSATATPAPAEAKPDTRKTLYMYGRLQSVDCSADPAAILLVRKGPKLMKLRTDDYKKLLVMGEDEFSCDWRDRKVLVNYKPGGKADGDIVTLELEAGK
jgi:tetratricopeptide (TPR) repeat protein